MKIQKRPSHFLDHMREEDADFTHDSRAALLNKTTPYASVILYTILSLFLIFFIWAYFAKIDQIVVGDGKVIPSSQVKLIQNLDGGILADLTVKEGDIVNPGQMLGHLDGTRYMAEYQQSYQKYLALTAMVARLQAEADNQNAVTFPQELHAYPDLMQRETNLFNDRKEALKKELDNLNLSYDSAQKQLALMEPAVEKGIVSRLQFLQMQLTVNDLKTKLLTRENTFKEEALTELNQRNADLAVITESAKALKDKINRTTLTSPTRGIVKKIYINTRGGVIQPAQTIMDIVPLDDTLLVQARVRPSDIGFVHVGQPATVQITAYEYSVYGYLQGKVEQISADALEDPKNPNNDYYLVKIRTDKNYLAHDNRELFIIPGMGAVVHINIGKRTVMQYLLKPLFAVKQGALGVQ